MDNLTKILHVALIVILSLFNMNCSKTEKNVHTSNTPQTKCVDGKVELFLKEMFSKRYLYRNVNTEEDKDSTLNYNYLYTRNLILDSSIYYFSIWKNHKPDSVKLIYIQDTNARKIDANKLFLNFQSIERDTSKISLKVTYSTGKNIALNWSTSNYEFDSLKCKWVLNDSTFEQY